MGNHRGRDGRIAVGLDSSMLHAVNELGSERRIQPNRQLSASTHSFQQRKGNHQRYHDSHGNHNAKSPWYYDQHHGYHSDRRDELSRSDGNCCEDHESSREQRVEEGYRSKTLPRLSHQQNKRHYRSNDNEYFRNEQHHHHQGHQEEDRRVYRQQISMPSRVDQNSPNNCQDDSDDFHHHSGPGNHIYDSTEQQHVVDHPCHSTLPANFNHQSSTNTEHQHASVYRDHIHPKLNFNPHVPIHYNQTTPSRGSGGYDTYDYPTNFQQQVSHKRKAETSGEHIPFNRPRSLQSPMSKAVSFQGEEVCPLYDYPRVPSAQAASATRQHTPPPNEHMMMESCASSMSSPQLMSLNSQSSAGNLQLVRQVSQLDSLSPSAVLNSQTITLTPKYDPSNPFPSSYVSPSHENVPLQGSPQSSRCYPPNPVIMEDSLHTIKES